MSEGKFTIIGINWGSNDRFCCVVWGQSAEDVELRFERGDYDDLMGDTVDGSLIAVFEGEQENLLPDADGRTVW